jgi:hypothetical protein
MGYDHDQKHIPYVFLFSFILLFCVAALAAEVTNVYGSTRKHDQKQMVMLEWLFPVEMGGSE